MRGVLTRVVLSTVFLSLQVAALPRPQVADNADPSVVSDGTSTGPGAANPFPTAGQGLDPGDGSAASTASTPATTSNEGSSVAGSVGQDANAGDGSAVSTPSTPDITSSDPSAPANNAVQGASAGDGSVVSAHSTPATASWRDRSRTAGNASTVANITHIDPPSELTGQLLGMSKCGGIYYNPKWDV